MEILSFALVQLQESLAPHTADPHGLWHDCTLNNERCSPSQIQFLQGMPYSICWRFFKYFEIRNSLLLTTHRTGFRIHMLNTVKRFAASRQNGLFINSCFAHCQSERQDTWFSDNSPTINNKVCLRASFLFVMFKIYLYKHIITTWTWNDMQPIALAVGDWYFDRSGVKAIDCAYPCDRTCHNLVFKWDIQ